MSFSSSKKIVLISFLLTIIFTFPVFFRFWNSIPGRGSDTYQAIARTTLVQNQIKQVGWLQTFRWQKDADFWGILPIIGYTQTIFGQLVGYNLWWLFSFLFAFLGMYFFAKDLTKSKWGALTAGFIFSFAPFHFAQATATNIGTMHYEWLPWLAFFLHRFFKAVSWQNALGVSAFFILIIATEHQLLAFFLLFLLLYIPFLIFLHPESLRNWRFWLIVASGLITISLIGAIQYKKIWEIAHSGDNFLIPPYSQVEDYSANVIDFLLPARFQPFWGEKFNAARSSLASNQEGRQTFYLGYLAIFLALFGFFSSLRGWNKASPLRRWTIFWMVVTLIFLILSLGPTLHWRGTTYLSQKMPYYWLYLFIPYWNYIRTTSRIFVIALLGFSILTGFGSKFLEKFLRKNWSKNYFSKIVAGLFILGIPLEYLSLPVPKLNLDYSPFYTKIAKETDNYSILEIPGATSYDFGSYSMYTATVHQKNKIDGIDFARSDDSRWKFQKSTPIIEKLLYSLPTSDKETSEIDGSNGDIIVSDYTSIAKSIFNFYHIRYITVSKDDFSQKFDSRAYDNTIKYLEQNLGLQASYEDKFLKAYRIPEETPRGIFLTIDTDQQNNGWGEKEGTGKSRSRWARDGSGLKLINMSSSPVNAEIDFKANIKYLRQLKISLDGQPVKDFFLKEFKGDYSFIMNQVSPGEHKLTFQILDENDSPVNNPSAQSDLGIKFSQFASIEK